ncbi:MAG: hypothetical protein CMF62_00040 [Magnetococcales bacterium]|nr:hypothetical protein [Magnetococcales bacterium]|tara:strand:- start:1121 stop:1843 length:723 start_codon:yes stop_codon:yes gene_type:complete
MANKTEYIDSQTQKRLIRDISDIFKNPLTEHCIYYQHDDTNMLKGYAMIIGPPDSLYQHGFYFFEFHFPTNYPQSPPTVKTITNDGYTRFHPNLYKNGKVCLSILNTWKGEGWTSCQTIKTILLTLVSILDDKPLLHEPGIRENNIDFEKYNKIIEYKNITHSFLDYVSMHLLPIQFLSFSSIMKEYAVKNKESILNFAKEKSEKYDTPIMTIINIYRMKTIIDWHKTYKNLQLLYSQLK